MAEELSQCTFIVKLWQMLADDANFGVLAWDESGNSFHIHGSLGAISKMLQKYFRHNKYSSFQRQLNYFGFQKTKLEDGTVIYHHKFFCLDRPNDVPKIKRKTNTGAREKMQMKLGKRKLKSKPLSPPLNLHRIAQLPQPKRVRSCISPAQQARTASTRMKVSLSPSLSDITNKSAKARAISARRSRRLVEDDCVDTNDSQDDIEQNHEQELPPLVPIQFEEVPRYSFDGTPLEKLYPQFS